MGGLAQRLNRAIILVCVTAGLGTHAFADESDKDNSGNTPVTVPIAPAAKESSVQELAANSKKSVVVIRVTGRDVRAMGVGSGFIVRSDGLIATNLHVIGEARPIQIELHDGRKFEATSVHATDRSQDLAVLKIDAADLPALQLGDSDELQVGQALVGIGNPLGLERSVVSGILSARRVIDGRVMLQIAVPIERGNSGGPVLDLQQRAQGLLTLKSLETENLGFAVAINALKPLLEKPNPIPMARWLTIGAIDPNEWTVPTDGRWRQRAGLIVVEGTGGGLGGRSICLSNEFAPTEPFEVSVQVKYSPADGAAGLVFNSDGGDKHYGFYLSNGGVRLSRFDGPNVYSWAVLKEHRTPAVKSSTWNTLKVRLEKEKILCFLNGEKIFESIDATYKTGRLGLCKFRQTEAEFKGFRVGSSLVDSRPSEELRARVTQTTNGLSLDDRAATNAIERLTNEESTVVDILEEQATALDHRAARIRQIAADVYSRKNSAELRRVILSEPVDLLHGALLIAKIDNPDLDVNGYIQQVTRHAKRAQTALIDEASEDEKFAALNRYLFEEQGFHGSRLEYAHRANSYISAVLDDREGLPITLSVLYIEIAKRMGLKVVGVGMPGHFLARHEPKEGTAQLVDVFDRGRLLTNDQAKTLFLKLSERPWDEAFLNSITPQATLERMLRNLLSEAIQANDIERILRYLDAVLAIVPDSGIDRFHRGRICFYTQRYQQARSEVEWLLNHDSSVARQEIEALENAISRDSQQ